MDQQKIHFLKYEIIAPLKTLSPASTGKWGKMNGQQMIEHVADFFKVSFEEIRFPLSIPEEHLPKYRAFLLSDKEFRENTKAPVLPENPFPVRNINMQSAINELSEDVTRFFQYFEDNPEKKTMHPAFGELDFSEWVQLHYKHVMHHLKQFELIQQ